MKRIAIAAAAALLLSAGCAMLPLDNEPPEAPVLESDGDRVAGFGLPVAVTCEDPDGDRVALRFRAVAGPSQVDFAWTSYVESGEETIFYLDLPPGAWRLEAWARDEMDETGATSTLDLTVTD